MHFPLIDKKHILDDQNYQMEAIDESSEYMKHLETSDKTIRQISIDQIRNNPKNNRTMNDIDVLRESIRNANRLFDPLLVGTKWKGMALEDFGEQFIFSSIDGGKPMNKNMPGRKLHQIIQCWNQTDEGKKRPIKNIRAYDLRHTFATLLISWGVPPTAVAYALGHVDLAMVNSVYAHVMEQKETGRSIFDVHADAINEEAESRKKIMEKLSSLTTEELELLILADKKHDSED